jgi:uncharacterized protein
MRRWRGRPSSARLRFLAETRYHDAVPRSATSTSTNPARRSLARELGVMLATGALVSCEARPCSSGVEAGPDRPVPAAAERGVPARKGTTVSSPRTARDACRLSVDDCVANCESGDGESCSIAANLVGYGRGVPADQSRAAQLAAKGCELGSAGACTSLAWFLSEGRGVPKDVVRAAELHDQACRQGYLVACSNLGTAYEGGAGVPADVQRAKALYLRACEEGGGDAAAHGCYNLGRVHHFGVGGEPDRELARLYLTRSALNGHGLAHAFLSEGEKDEGRRGYLLENACLRGVQSSCDALASEGINWRTFRPEGTHQCDIGNAYECKTECRRGHLGSCALLGRMLREEKSQVKAPTEGMALLRRACDGGMERACSQIAVEVLMKQSSVMSVEEAVRTLQSSCDAGDGIACLMRASSIRGEAGKYTPEAVRLLEKACRWGAGFACGDLAMLPERAGEASEFKRKACLFGAKKFCDA